LWGKKLHTFSIVKYQHFLFETANPNPDVVKMQIVIGANGVLYLLKTRKPISEIAKKVKSLSFEFQKTVTL